MTARRITAWGFGISGALSILVGVVFFVTEVTPDWLPLILAVVGAIAPLLGIKISRPAI